MTQGAAIRNFVVMTTNLHRLSGIEVASLTTTHRPHAESMMLWTLAAGAALILVVAGIASLLG